MVRERSRVQVPMVAPLNAKNKTINYRVGGFWFFMETFIYSELKSRGHTAKSSHSRVNTDRADIAERRVIFKTEQRGYFLEIPEFPLRLVLHVLLL